ncbi:MAG: hypothetical protein GY793_05280 [Proteobacteria bacterium]|nr:hypothetical protein [Pseudomonadota bacterium]
MNYILTEEEYNKLINFRVENKKLIDKENEKIKDEWKVLSKEKEEVAKNQDKIKFIQVRSEIVIGLHHTGRPQVKTMYLSSEEAELKLKERIEEDKKEYLESKVHCLKKMSIFEFIKWRKK